MDLRVLLDFGESQVFLDHQDQMVALEVRGSLETPDLLVREALLAVQVQMEALELMDLQDQLVPQDSLAQVE
jgi:hypothetical protein